MRETELSRTGEIWITFIIIWLVIGLAVGLTLYLPFAQPEAVAVAAGAGIGLVLAYFGARSATVRRRLALLVELVAYFVEILFWVLRLFRIWH